MTWSSLITGLETSTGEKLVQCAEMAGPIMITRTLCQEPETVDDACPHLPKQLILSLMKNVRPDEMMSENVDVSAFAERYELDPTVDVDHVEPLLDGDYMSLAKGIRVSDWNACEIQHELLTNFPYLREFITLAPSVE